jgi:hypothetical protein
MSLGLGLDLSVGRGSSAIAINDTITLANGAWIWGSSSPAGNQDASGVTMFTATALLIDPTYTTANETISSVTAPKYTMGGKILHNRGVSGRKTTEIATDEANCAASVGASDFKFLHQGDNQDAGVTDVQFVDSVMTQFAAGRTSLSISLPATNFIHLVNTYGGMNAGRTDSAEKIGDKTTGKKEIIHRKLNALQQGAVAAFYWTLQDHAADYGYQDATNDPIDISKGISPRGFMISDGSHMNQYGYNVIAQYLLTPILAGVNGGCPFINRQFLNPVTPASPAGGDVIGTPNVFGTGATYSLAATNTQTDYTINASTGSITRIGATPPTRDFTQVHIQTAKSGKTSRVQKNVWVGEKAASGVSSLVRFDGYGVIGHVASDWAVAATLTVIFRLRGAAGADSVSQTVFAQAGSTGGVTITRNASNQIDILFRQASNTSILSMTSASNTFRNSDGQKWVMASIDIPSGLAKCTTFVTPTTTVVTITNSAGANTALLADNTAKVTMTNQHGFAAVGSGPTFSQLASARGKFDIGDFWMGAVYLDPTVQANRELFVDSGGSPLPALLATSDGVVSGTSPLLYCRGNATDWRLCNFIPSTVQMHFGNYLNPGTSERGYLTSV